MAVTLLVALLSAASAAFSEQTGGARIIAYMTSDRELVPIARFDGTNWRNTWPEPIRDDEPLPVRTIKQIPRAWLGQPVPLTWMTWTQEGKQQSVTVTGLDRDGSCVQAITLATSFTPEPASEGLAFDRPTRVDGIVEAAEGSLQWEQLRRELAPHFRTAARKAMLTPGSDAGELGTRALALGRADTFADSTVVLAVVLRDSRSQVFFIEGQRHFRDISAETDFDALSYSGWFRRESGGALMPISASVVPFSTAQGKLPRYTPIGILRLGRGSIWVLSEWGIESQTIVLFDVSAKGTRKLSSALISGC